MNSILIVDDDTTTLEMLSEFLKDEGYLVYTAEKGREAINIVEKDLVDLVLLDLKLGDMNGMEVFHEIKKMNPEIQVVMITAYGEIETAVKAIKAGAYDFLSKPINMDELRIIIDKVLEKRELLRENRELKEIIKKQYTFEGIIGTSEKMQEVFSIVKRVAPTDSTVLIRGESGTGKELIARLVHQLNPRREKPFIKISCAAIPEGLIESELFGYEKGAFTGADKKKEGKLELAHEGTVFLDEIGDMPLSLQVKILRVLQEKEFERLGGKETIKVDVRIITATNRDLEYLITQKMFREDLYFRINVISIFLPPLIERKEDIRSLTEFFFEKYCLLHNKKIKGISKEAWDWLFKYSWPGNVRELENIIERAVVLAREEIITSRDLPPESMFISEEDIIKDRECTLDELEKIYIKKILQKTKGNKNEAARILGVHRNTLSRKIKESEIKS